MADKYIRNNAGELTETEATVTSAGAGNAGDIVALDTGGKLDVTVFPAGVTVPSGGTTGQVLAKKTNTNYDTEWVDQTGGGGISDGDKGDITVSGSGASWAIDNAAVTYAKIQNVSATDKLLGRSSSGAGVVEEIACTAAGRALLDDADASAQRTTLGLKTGATTNITTSTSDPSGGSDGDVWIKYTA